MSPPTAADLTHRRRVIVADEDPKVVEFIIKTLREDGHAVFHGYDGLSATEWSSCSTSANCSSPIPR